MLQYITCPNIFWHFRNISTMIACEAWKEHLHLYHESHFSLSVLSMYCNILIVNIFQLTLISNKNIETPTAYPQENISYLSTICLCNDPTETEKCIICPEQKKMAMASLREMWIVKSVHWCNSLACLNYLLILFLTTLNG